MKSTLTSPGNGLHVGIIMDGNGRWAQRKGQLRAQGHRAGADAVRRVVRAAEDTGIATLTLFAFSGDNWRRPPSEVNHLFLLFRRALRSESARCIESGIRVSVIGRRDRLSRETLREIASIEDRTRIGRNLHLRLAIDYSSRDALAGAAKLLGGMASVSRGRFRSALAKASNAPLGTPDVDLLIRTGGEKRLSDFLLWESAYAELLFTDTLWPDFTVEELRAAVDAFWSRDRRFGGLPPGKRNGFATLALNGAPR